MERAFEPAESAGGVEELRVHAADIVRGAVVAREDDERVVGHAGFLERGHEPADVLVEAGDHRGVGRERGAVRYVGTFGGGGEGLVLGELAFVGLQVLGGQLERDVRQGGREVEEERALSVGGDECFGAGDEAFGREVLAGEGGVSLRVLRVGARREASMTRHALFAVVERHFLAVLPDGGRVVAVRDPLARQAEEFVEPLDVGPTGGIVTAETPFAERPGHVARLTEDIGHRRDAGRERNLFALTDVEVVAHGGAAGIKSGHQHRAGRGADRVAAIVPGQHETLLGETVEVRGQDFRLPHEAHFAVAQVVGQDEDDVGTRLGGRGQASQGE